MVLKDLLGIEVTYRANEVVLGMVRSGISW